MSSEKYTAIIVDDEPGARDVLENLLKSIPEIRVLSKDASVDEAINSLTSLQPDLIFLDIGMPGKDGFELANYIRKRNIETGIIFTTAYNQHAIEAFKVSAFDYLLKPVDMDELHNTINRFKKEYKDLKLNKKIDLLTDYLTPQKVRFNSKNGFIMIDPKKIVYCKADGNYCFLYLNSGKEEHITQQLGKVEEKLNNNLFIRISRSVLINKSYISSFNRHNRKIKLINILEEIEFKVSREALKELE